MKKFKLILLVACVAVMLCALAGCSHEHHYVTEIIKEATCTEPGSSVDTCSLCGDKKKEEIIPALGHDYDTDADGEKIWTYDADKHWYECTRCSDKDQIATHNFNADLTCTVCGFEQFTFQKTEGGYILSKNNSSLTDVTVPSTYKNESVIGIGKEAFEGTAVKSIVIPSSIKSIARDAFANCAALQSVSAPSLADWCAIKFENYAANPVAISHSLTLGGVKVEGTLDLAGVTSVGEYAFYGLGSLVEISVPSTLTSIGYRAFDGAFASEGDLKVNITDLAAWCAIEFSNGKIDLDKCTANPLSSGATLALNGSPVTSVSTASINKVNAFAFFGYGKLSTLTIGDTKLGDFAFAHCDGLTSVTVNGATAISKGAFEGCTQLATVDFGGVQTIGDRAFFDCKSLASATLTSVSSIGEQAFYNCEALAALNVSDSVLTRIGAGALFNTKLLNDSPSGLFYVGNVLYTYKGSPNDFEELEAAYVVVRAGTIAIADGAFENVSGLLGLTIPDSVTYIGKNALRYSGFATSEVEYVVIGSGVTEIGEGAFDGLIYAYFYFNGNEEDWQAIDPDGDLIEEYYLYFFSASYPYDDDENLDVNYWHYGEDGPEPWDYEY